MGARLGHLALTLAVLLGGCSNRLSAPAESPAQRPPASTTPAPNTATSIPEPTPSAPPYADADSAARAVAEAFVRGVLAYDATAEDATAFLPRVAPDVTPSELARLRRSPRAHVDWRVLRERKERVTVAVLGVSVSAFGRVLVEVERTTHTDFGTVRDFLELSLELVPEGGTFVVAGANGAGL